MSVIGFRLEDSPKIFVDLGKRIVIWLKDISEVGLLFNDILWGKDSNNSRYESLKDCIFLGKVVVELGIYQCESFFEKLVERKPSCWHINKHLKRKEKCHVKFPL